ncbi:hypothetical protein Q7P37_004078 [Cladosporium fusiforme]
MSPFGTPTPALNQPESTSRNSQRFRWSLDQWSEVYCRRVTKFRKRDFRKLLRALRIRHISRWSVERRPSSDLALAVTLRRFAYPCTWADLEGVFGRSARYLSLVFDDVVAHIMATSCPLIEWHPRLRQANHRRQLALAVAMEGCPGPIWGFIESHFISSSRPQKRQRDGASARERAQGISTQIITTPDGLISSLDGPFEGKQKGSEMYEKSRASRRNERMEAVERSHGWSTIHLWGQSGYECGPGLIAAWPGTRRSLSEDKIGLNEDMADLKVGAEDAFGTAFTHWTYNSFIEESYTSNQDTCLEGGNDVSMKFDLDPPTLEEYFELGEDAFVGIE